MTQEIRRIDVLGVHISDVDLAQAVAEIEIWIEAGLRHYVCVTGVHGVMESIRDPSLAEIHNNSGMTTPDGVPMVWAGRWAGSKSITRVYGPELMDAVCARSEFNRWRHYLYGATPDVTTLLAGRLRDRFPDITICGTENPPFRTLSDKELIEVTARINAASPDIVWVGLSTPKQERWMAAARPLLRAAVLVGVGAAFDINAGTARQAPPAIRRVGLEWAFRLLQEPRRLWRRYLINNPSFVVRILARPPRYV